MTEEIQRIRERYDNRQTSIDPLLYNPLRPSVYMSQQEKERAIIKLINNCNLEPVKSKKVLEIGCGSGTNLLQLIKLGFSPENLIGNELLDERARQARLFLPSATKIMVGDASTLNLDDNQFDIVLQSTVFTSILDKNFQEQLADNIWAKLKLNGGILWYDFIYDNPKNKDVKGISVKEIKRLFPQGEMKVWKLTLAPPINRFLTDRYPPLYDIVNSLVFLRTHVLCWIQKIH
jgi:SAM-dependent methyltransferase